MSNRLVYLKRENNNVRHYCHTTYDGKIYPFCKVICWKNLRLTTSKKGRICKDCNKLRKRGFFGGKGFTLKPLREKDFTVKGLKEKYCFEGEA